MNSSNSTDDPTPSFSFRNTTETTFLRSHSSKEPPAFSDLIHSPPRLSCPSLSRSLQASPLHPHTATNTKLSADSDEPQSTYHCASSVLRKDGQILCISLSNGLVYTGSDSNVIRVWKLPEFTECGQIRTKACRVVAIEVSNDTIFAAYGDGKIRVWRRTWDPSHRVFKHVRLATIPKKVGSVVRSYILGRDKTVSENKQQTPLLSRLG